MSGIGHNRGPSIEGGTSWRRHCWTRARARLLPTLPVEVVRLRVKRAREIGLDYQTYAGIRATTGHDLAAFLFSSNALGLLRGGDRIPGNRSAKLSSLCDIGSLVAVHVPFDPEDVGRLVSEQTGRIVTAARAPAPLAAWSEIRASLGNLCGEVSAPADRVLVIGAAEFERDWVSAGRFAGFLPADRYFQPLDGWL